VCMAVMMTFKTGRQRKRAHNFLGTSLLVWGKGDSKNVGKKGKKSTALEGERIFLGKEKGSERGGRKR